MSCTNCKEIHDPDLPFADFDFIPKANFKKKILVRVPNKPRGGWSVVVPVKGSVQKIDGVNAHDVAHNAKKLLKLNGYNVDENALWFNLNVQWLQKTADKFQVTPLAELLKQASGEVVVNEDKHAPQKVSTDSWLPGSMAFLKAYCGSDTYKWDTFLGFVNELQRLLNPSENPLMGNSSQYLRFTIHLDKIKKNPAYQGADAKLWLNEFPI